MKVIFVYEHFFEPFDEGVKNFANMVFQKLAEQHEVNLIRNIAKFPNFLNSLLLVPRLLIFLLLSSPDKLIFIPQASLTFSSLLKCFILRLFYRGKLTTVGTQKRILSPTQKAIIRRLNVGSTYVLSSSMIGSLREININPRIVNVGIDRIKYAPADNKTVLRKKYNLSLNQKILLHVGHIKEKRNVRWLLEVQRQVPEIQTILVGSTSTEQDIALSAELEESGVIVLKDYQPDIQEIYQLADIYCFTVTRSDAAMETPLSVLEAMATELPVITTNFGRLPEQFSEDPIFKYANSPSEFVAILQDGFGEPQKPLWRGNREKTVNYTWEMTTRKLLS